LAQALDLAWPFLTPELQQRVSRYLADQLAVRPAFQTTPEQYYNGVKRHPYPIDQRQMDGSDMVARRDAGYRASNHLHEFYGLERLMARTGQSPDEAVKKKAMSEVLALADRLDWAILGPGDSSGPSGRGLAANYWTMQGSATYNRWCAGLIGVLRMARSEGWSHEEPMLYYLAARLMLARMGQARCVSEMHARGLVRGPVETDDRAVSHIDAAKIVIARGPVGEVVNQDQEIPPFIDLVEPLGRLLGQCASDECGIYLDHLDTSMPLFFVSEAVKQSATEQHISPLQHLNGNVLAQYWVLDKTGPAFARYVDTTRLLGDLYYIQNVSALLQSWSQVSSKQGF
jgi:hypothetical protein